MTSVRINIGTKTYPVSVALEIARARAANLRLALSGLSCEQMPDTRLGLELAALTGAAEEVVVLLEQVAEAEQGEHLETSGPDRKTEIN